MKHFWFYRVADSFVEDYLDNYHGIKLDKKLITVDWEPTFLGRLFRFKPYTGKYVDGHSYPDGAMVSISLQMRLFECLEKGKFRKHMEVKGENQ